MNTPASVTIGATTITALNVGEIRFDLNQVLERGDEAVPPEEQAFFAQALHVPIQCFLIRTPEALLLVDACFYEVPADSPFSIPDYQPPPSLIEQLAVLGVQPGEINHVIVTHAHFDHYNGVTHYHTGSNAPTFPHARYYFSRADWEYPDFAAAIQKPESLEARTLGALQQQGLLELIDGSDYVGGGVQIIAAPGETPGHQIVRIHSQGQTAYCVGDLYHHTVEVTHPHWVAIWANRAANLHSRETFVPTAQAEDALVLATHIHGAGRLKSTVSGGLCWVTV